MLCGWFDKSLLCLHLGLIHWKSENLFSYCSLKVMTLASILTSAFRYGYIAQTPSWDLPAPEIRFTGASLLGHFHLVILFFSSEDLVQVFLHGPYHCLGRAVETPLTQPLEWVLFPMSCKLSIFLVISFCLSWLFFVKLFWDLCNSILHPKNPCWLSCCSSLHLLNWIKIYLCDYTKNIILEQSISLVKCVLLNMYYKLLPVFFYSDN